MNTKTVEYVKGKPITYEWEDGHMAFHHDTPLEVRRILENAYEPNNRGLMYLLLLRRTGWGAMLRIFYGDKETGRDWNEEFDTYGYIGRSTGEVKIPLLIPKRHSMGGPAISDDCIVKIMQGRRVLWQHPKYHIDGTYAVKHADDDLRSKGYYASVFLKESNVANFQTFEKAHRWVAFMKGERHTKGGKSSKSM